MKSHPFTNPQLSPETLDIHVMRSALLARMRQTAPLFSGTLLDVGCGKMPYRDLILSHGRVQRYLGLDLEGNPVYSGGRDLSWDGVTIPLAENSVDCAMATEVLEHCPQPEAVLTEIRRVLRPGGIFFCTVPFLWPLHDAPYDEYRFTPFSLRRHLAGAGFAEVRLHPLGGWNESLAQMVGLFVRRRPMPPSLRRLLSLAAWPLIYLLIRKRSDELPDRGCQENLQQLFAPCAMFPGMAGLARKPIAGERELRQNQEKRL